MAKRKYAISDMLLLQYADTISAQLPEDIDKFHAFDPQGFPMGLPAIIEQKATGALAKDGDDGNKAAIGSKTLRARQQTERCRDYLEGLKYWAKGAYPDSPAIQRQFGVGRTTGIFRTRAALLGFMEGLPGTIKTHRAKLEGAGAPTKVLDGATPRYKALQKAHKALEKQKGDRPIATQARIDRLNELYRILQKLDKAAALVFKGKPAQRNRYKVPRQNRGGTGTAS